MKTLPFFLLIKLIIHITVSLYKFEKFNTDFYSYSVKGIRYYCSSKKTGTIDTFRLPKVLIFFCKRCIESGLKAYFYRIIRTLWLFSAIQSHFLLFVP